MTLDEKFMRRALALARRGEGCTRPNPPVGAVVVRAGRVVGAGWHARAGGPHAEVVALRQAGAQAKGGTLYVTLEPCSTWGRTPPCTDAILVAGVRRVVAAIRDPNPRHAGRGLRLLRKAGVAVTDGVCRTEAQELIAPFARHILHGLPYVTLKLAMTLDGKIADHTGHSRWITSSASRREVQALRRRADAIMVGAGTVRRDDPGLLPRPARGRAPYRVIISQSGKVPPKARVFCDESAAQTLLFTTPAGAKRLSAGDHPWNMLTLPGGKNGLPLRRLLRQLARMGIMHVLCEGGGELAAGLLRAGLVDEAVFFIAPKILGGKSSPGVVGGSGWLLARAPELEIVESRRYGPDLMIRCKMR